MSSRTVVWAFLVSLTLACGALADPNDTYAGGLLHVPLGDVRDLSVDGRRLTACCLGSSGEDGVEVRFDSLWGGGVGVELTPLLSGTVAELQCVSKGWDGTVKGRLRIAGYGDGSIMSFVDFSELGATGVRTISYDPDGHLLSDVLTPGPIQAYPDVPDCPPPGVPTWWQTSYGQWVWGCAYGQDPHGNPYPYLRVVTPVPPLGTPGGVGVGGLEITGTDVGELNLIDASIGTFGVSSWGLGQAHLREQCDIPGGCTSDQVVLVADNLGVSGEDGIAIDLGEDVGRAVLRTGKCCRGHVIIMKAFDDEGQEIMRAQTLTDPVVDGEELSVDFSGMGASAIDVEFLDETGQSLRQYPIGGLPFGGWMSGMCPPGCAEIWEQDWYSGRWTFVRCDCLSSFNFELPSGEVVSGVHSIVFRPAGVTSPMLRKLELTTDDPDSAITVLGVTVEPRCPADLNRDGQIGLADLAGLLAHYGMTGGALPKDGDLDGDGDVDLSDLAALLAVYGSSCPGTPEFAEAFDGYGDGSGMHGQGGWKGWDADPAADARVTSAQAHSAPHAVDVHGASDLVHEFSGLTSGRWVITAWQYVPSGFVSGCDGSGNCGSYFVLLNTYSDGGPYDWSAHFHSDSITGTIIRDGSTPASLPLITDRWVELRVEVNLDADTYRVFYDGLELGSQETWSDGPYGGGSGVPAIGAIDLFANGSSTVYYDSIAITPR